MTVLTEETERVVLDGNEVDPEDIIHVVCLCTEDVALCGEELGGAFWDNVPEEDECVVCIDLAKFPCPRCGEPVA